MSGEKKYQENVIEVNGKPVKIFHGGCVGCVIQVEYGIGNCAGCMYANWGKDLPDLGIRRINE